MRAALLLLCLFSLTGCGLVNRLIPRPKLSPRVILVENTLQTPDPCAPDAVVLALASAYGNQSVARLPS